MNRIFGSLVKGAHRLTEANKALRKAQTVRTRLEVEDAKRSIRIGAYGLVARNALHACTLGEDTRANNARVLGIALGRPLNTKTIVHLACCRINDRISLVQLEKLNTTERAERADNGHAHITENLCVRRRDAIANLRGCCANGRRREITSRRP